MKIRYTATARAEAEEIFTHIARDNPVAAAAVAATIKGAVARLAVFPRIGARNERSERFRKNCSPVSLSDFL
jgi:plasmid stabilization system protein ParE